MYAVIEDGGKQYKVSEGDELLIERRPDRGDAKEITFDRVLLIGTDGGPKIGAPLISGASVTALVLAELKTRKVVGMKHRRRKGFRKKWGHRQKMLRVKIASIRG
ncbi:MAG: 50S ribosomal protein L21 [Phycisphaerales bacterium]|nr:50S ribosomal protein L21 [Phycisphaerales bacterium]